MKLLIIGFSALLVGFVIGWIACSLRASKSIERLASSTELLKDAVNKNKERE